MREFKSFYKTVKTAEGMRCKYPTRLDTYGCGCLHNCDYCYARSLLDFRNLWHPEEPAVADIEKIKRKLDKLPAGTVLRLGGMTDCLQPCEREYKVTYQTIKAMNERRIEYLIVTKSDLISEYADILNADLAHIQISITGTEPNTYENAPDPEKRIKALLSLQNDFDAAIRLSPLIADYMDFNKLSTYGIKKAVIEFLRVNTWVKRWLKINLSDYTLKSGGYYHMPLEKKISLLEQVKIPDITICEDVPVHYEYWKNNINPNKNDCCNLRRSK